MRTRHKSHSKTSSYITGCTEQNPMITTKDYYSEDAYTKNIELFPEVTLKIKLNYITPDDIYLLLNYILEFLSFTLNKCFLVRLQVKFFVTFNLVISRSQINQQSYIIVSKKYLMLTKREEETTKAPTKRSYSYSDIISMQNDIAYSTIGRVIPSQKPSAPRATFGNSQRKNIVKLKSQQPFLKTLAGVGGKQGLGPAAYLPSRFTNAQGQETHRSDIDSNLKYNSTPSFSIGKQPRKGQQLPIYNYMHSKNDPTQLNAADLKRRNSTPSIRIGTDQRFHEQRKDKITPGPTYDPKLKPDAQEAPKYTLGARRAEKGKDPLNPPIGTTNLVGPSSYFQKGGKSHSTSSLSRVPYDSKLKNQPIVSFTKGPKTLATYKNSVDETYDIKHKTILAHYDFQYDAGKGLNSGRAWEKKYLQKCSQMPLQKNKMKSYTMVKSSRQTEGRRGTFVSMMSQVPSAVRIQHLKF